METVPFFVYGTLLLDVGQPNTHCWLGAAERHAAAALLDASLFAHPSFPMMLLGESGSGRVRGQVVWVRPDDYERVLRSLDALEEFDPDHADASLYLRARVNVQLEADGTTVECFTYVAKSVADVASLPRIESGDWVEFCAREPSRLDWWREQARSGADVREQATPTQQQ
jgi:gamma-glutamylcyclotransferase (GGCT)/AIG2-like uncharacterized protein YtfP